MNTKTLLIKKCILLFIIVFTILLSSLIVFAENETIINNNNNINGYNINFMFKDFNEEDPFSNSHNIIKYSDIETFNYLYFNLEHYSPNFDGFNKNDIRIMSNYDDNKYKIYVNNTEKLIYILLREYNGIATPFLILFSDFLEYDLNETTLNNSPILYTDNFNHVENITNGNTYLVNYYDDDEVTLLYSENVTIYYNYLNNYNYEIILDFDNNINNKIIFFKIDLENEFITESILFYMSPDPSQKFGTFNIWSCPSSTQQYFILFIIMLLILFLLFLSKISNIFGIMSGIIIFLLYFIIGACSPIMLIPLAITGLLLMIYFTIK